MTIFRKIQRGFEASRYQKNKGSPQAHPSASQHRRSIKRGNGISLTNDNAQLWYGSIIVGTPAETFTGTSSFNHNSKI